MIQPGPMNDRPLSPWWIVVAFATLCVVAPPALHYWLRWAWFWIDGSVCR